MGDENTALEVMDLESLDDSQVNAFMEKGELPTATEKPETDAAGQSAEVEVDADDEGAAQDLEAADTTQQQQKPEKHLSRQERRNIRYAEEVKQLRAEVDRLRTERPASDTQQQQQAEKPARKPAPKLKDFATFEEYESARDGFDAEQRKLDLQEMLKSERETLTAKEQETAKTKAVEKTANDFAARAKDYRKTLKDDDFPECLQEVVEATSQHGHLSDAIAESEVGPQLVSYFAEHPKELDRLKGLSANAALREFGKLETKMQAPAPKTKTGVKRTASDLAGRGGSSSLEDQITDAMERGDQKAVDRLMDQLDKAAL